MDCCDKTKHLLPSTIPAGLNFEALVELCDFPAPDWTLVAILRGPAAIDLEATAQGAAHLFSEDGDTTGAWAPGVYAYELRATKDGKTERADFGQVTIEADLASAEAGYDPRSDNQKALDAINAVLAKRATLDQERYRINNRELYRTSISDLLKLKSYYQSLVKREGAAGCGSGGKWGRKIPVNF